jgi:hypothetical protein
MQFTVRPAPAAKPPANPVPSTKPPITPAPAAPAELPPATSLRAAKAATHPAPTPPATPVPAAEPPPARVPPARLPVNQVPTMQFPARQAPIAKPSAGPGPAAKPPADPAPAVKPPGAAASAPPASIAPAQVPAPQPPATRVPIRRFPIPPAAATKPLADPAPDAASTASRVPTEAPPADLPPADPAADAAPPAQKAPADRSSADQPPAAKPPADQPPAAKPPAAKPPAAKPPAAAAPPAGGGSPAGKRSGKKASRSVFGPAPGERPDVLTNAETVVMAVLGTRARKSAAASDPDPMRAIQVTLTIPAVIAGQNPAHAAGDQDAAEDSAVVEVTHPAASSAIKGVPPPDMDITLAGGDADLAAARAAGWTKPGTQPTMSDEAMQFPALMWDADGAIAASQRGPAQAARAAADIYVPSRRRTRVSRAVLLGILCLQAILSLRLHNSAFKDEALYLYAGHAELVHLLHGTVLPGRYAAYFPGSPVLYPLVAGAFSELGGLSAARALSLVEMLAVTALLYSLSRRLFNERSALCAALIFSVSESAIFLGHYATFDASSLFLLAVAAWILVRTAGSRWPLFLLAAPVAALAVGVEYSAVLFLPTLILLPALAGWPALRHRVLLSSLGFGAVVSGLLAGGLKLGGAAYRTAISVTTTNRAPGITPARTILLHGAEWGGVLFALALFGTIAYAWNARTEPGEDIAPAGGRVRRALLGIVLTGTALLVPAYQVDLHANASFLEHIGFGLFFAAPVAGLGVARGLGDHFRRPHFPVAVWSLALVLGMVQSAQFFQDWPTSTRFVSAFATYLQPGAHYLVEVPQVPIYDLNGRADAQPSQFSSTAAISFTTTKKKVTQVLTGTAGFTAAVKAGYFHIIAFSDDVTPANDAALASALQNSKAYYLAEAIAASDRSGEVTYQIWVKGHAPDLAVGGGKGTGSRKVRD